MNPSEIKKYILKFKAKLFNMVDPDSDKAMGIRKTIGSLLVDLGIPPLNFSNKEVAFVIDFLEIPEFGKIVQDKIAQMKGLIGPDVAAQLVVADTLDPKRKKPELEPEAYTNKHVVSKETQEKIDQINPLKKGQTYIKGYQNREYREHSICHVCNKKKDNISAGTGSCYECDSKSEVEQRFKQTKVMDNKSFNKNMAKQMKKNSMPESILHKPKQKNWRVMPRDVLTGEYNRDIKLCTEFIEDLYMIKDAHGPKDTKFYEVVDMIKQYTFALGDVERQYRQQVRDDKYEIMHNEMCNMMNALTVELRKENEMFDGDISMTQKGLDAGKEIMKDIARATGTQINEETMKLYNNTPGVMVNDKEIPVEQVIEEINVATGTGIPLEIVMGTVPGTTPTDPPTFKETVKKLEKKKEKQLDLILETQISGEYTEPMKITTYTIPTRLLVDKDGKSIAFKDLSPEAKKEINSIRGKKAAATRRRNQLSKLNKISHADGDEY